MSTHACRYELIGFGNCNTTPGMLPCGPCRKRGVGVYAAAETTTAEPKHATAMEAEMARVTIPEIAAHLREYLEQRAMNLSRALMLAPPQPLVVSRADYDRMTDAGVLRVCGARRDDGSAFCAAQVGHDSDHEWVREVRYTTAAGWHRAPAAAPEPKPPTLREWLGPENVAKLGDWAGVLREQPVPAGMIVAWHWVGGRILQGYDNVTRGWVTILPDGIVHLWAEPKPTHGRGCADALEMALFTSHPAVKPAPKQVTPWNGNDPEVP